MEQKLSFWGAWGTALVGIGLAALVATFVKFTPGPKDYQSMVVGVAVVGWIGNFAIRQRKREKFVGMDIPIHVAGVIVSYIFIIVTP